MRFALRSRGATSSTTATDPPDEIGTSRDLRAQIRLLTSEMTDFINELHERQEEREARR